MEQLLDKRNTGMVTSSVVITDFEDRLLKTIGFVEFGTIGPVKVKDGPKILVRHLTKQQEKLLDVVRGYPALDRIIIHQGMVQYIEISGTREWPYTKKIKVD